MALKSAKNALLNLFACIPVSVVVAFVLLASVSLLAVLAYFALNFFLG